ncbi:MAG: SDR family oxidoreductase [Longimicrobiales bacterium]|nr:SDR family oxidoreductase [Longimicrobiales bacterium]
MEIEGRVGLVTGGAHRVGRALALALARAGADVAIHYHSSESDAAETAAEVRALGRRAETFQADLADPAAVASLASAVGDAMGRLDVLVNSASLFESARFEDVTVDAWDRVMAVNLRAPFLLLQATAPLLKASNGVAVNIADLAGVQVWPAFPHHGVSKAGLIHLTRVAARALAPDVRVSCIVPGTVLPPEDYTREQIETSVSRTVLERIGSPDDVVEALLFLVRSDFATGSIVTVDGGRTLK